MPKAPREPFAGRGRRAAALLLLALAVPAAAQEDVAPPPPPLVLPLADRFVWELRGALSTREAITGVAVQAGGTGVWLAVARDGTAYRTEDAGASWDRVLTGFALDGEGRSDEEILLDAESAMDEAREDVDEDELEPLDLDGADPEEAARAARDQAEEAVSDASEGTHASLEDAVDDVYLRAVGDGVAADGAPPPTVWLHPADPELALLSWPDATLRSTDGGLTWAAVDLVGATTFFSGADPRVIVAGTTDGVRWSLDDGETWLDVVDDTDGARVRQVSQEGAWLYAASDRGVFRSADGLHWRWLTALGFRSVRSVVPDPSWDGGLWVATDDVLLRSDDDGRTFYESSRHPLHGLRRVVAVEGQGHLLAITSDGVWESLDGGVRWLPAIKLLRSPDVWDVAFDGGVPVIATRSGVWRMVAPVSMDDRPGRRQEVMPAGVAISLAQHRAGLDLDPLVLARRQVAARITPSLVLNGYYALSDSRHTAFFEESTSEAHARTWGVTATACWGGCASTYITVDTDFGSVDVVDVDDVDPVYVIDGEVYGDDDVVGAAANVAQAVHAYRQTVAAAVTDAWIARQRLAAEAPLTLNLPLRDQVLHQLDLQEADARLDIYTDGAFRQSLRTTEEIR